MSSFDIAIKTVLFHEGGYVNSSQDPGGPTNYGVSLRWLRSIGDLDDDGYYDGDFNKDGKLDIIDIKNMNINDAIELYRQHWWNKYPYEKILDQAVATKAFDLAVNMGPVMAHRLLQRAVRAASGKRLKEDGILGQQTLTFINNASPLVLLAAYRSEAAGYYRSLRKPHYEEGWLERAYS